MFWTDWNKHLERLSINDIENFVKTNNRGSACVCASIRAQTLSRTVNCMMYYETLLRILANLEQVNEDTIDDSSF